MLLRSVARKACFSEGLLGKNCTNIKFELKVHKVVPDSFCVVNVKENAIGEHLSFVWRECHGRCEVERGK